MRSDGALHRHLAEAEAQRFSELVEHLTHLLAKRLEDDFGIDVFYED